MRMRVRVRVRVRVRCLHYRLGNEKFYLYCLRPSIRWHGLRPRRDVGTGEAAGFLAMPDQVPAGLESSPKRYKLNSFLRPYPLGWRPKRVPAQKLMAMQRRWGRRLSKLAGLENKSQEGLTEFKTTAARIRLSA